MIEHWRPISPAQAAGLELGDIIVAIDGKPADPRMLDEWIQSWHPGQTLKLEIVRLNGADRQVNPTFEVNVTLQ